MVPVKAALKEIVKLAVQMGKSDDETQRLCDRAIEANVTLTPQAQHRIDGFEVWCKGRHFAAAEMDAPAHLLKPADLTLFFDVDDDVFFKLVELRL